MVKLPLKKAFPPSSTAILRQQSQVPYKTRTKKSIVIRIVTTKSKIKSAKNFTYWTQTVRGKTRKMQVVATTKQFEASFNSTSHEGRKGKGGRGEEGMCTEGERISCCVFNRPSCYSYSCYWSGLERSVAAIHVFTFAIGQNRKSSKNTLCILMYTWSQLGEGLKLLVRRETVVGKKRWQRRSATVYLCDKIQEILYNYRIEPTWRSWSSSSRTQASKARRKGSLPASTSRKMLGRRSTRYVKHIFLQNKV